MYKYVGKTTNRRINKNWVFFTNDRTYPDEMFELGVGRGLPKEDFEKVQEEKPIEVKKPVEVKKEEKVKKEVKKK